MFPLLIKWIYSNLAAVINVCSWSIYYSDAAHRVRRIQRDLQGRLFHLYPGFYTLTTLETNH